MKILVTGGLGFIGVNLINELIKNKKVQIFNIDKVSYSSVPEALKNIKKNKRYHFSKLNLSNYNDLKKLFFKIKPNQIINLAAESHVDNSISNPDIFINSNIIGTYNLLKISNEFLNNYKINNFKFLHVSTDEVFGSLNKKQKAFTENSKYCPNSPYSASKASSDLLVKAWGKTFNIPILITNCSNNYGPWQNPEKLIPLVVYKCLKKENIPIYGNGLNIRDWIYVKDHIKGIMLVLKKGVISESYNIGTNCEITNLKLVKIICNYFNKKFTKKRFNYNNLITFVEDRKGHDFRYSIDNSKIKKKLKFSFKKNFSKDFENTIDWYIKNKEWLYKKIK